MTEVVARAPTVLLAACLVTAAALSSSNARHRSGPRTLQGCSSRALAAAGSALGAHGVVPALVHAPARPRAARHSSRLVEAAGRELPLRSPAAARTCRNGTRSSRWRRSLSTLRPRPRSASAAFDAVLRPAVHRQHHQRYVRERWQPARHLPGAVGPATGSESDGSSAATMTLLRPAGCL